MLSLTASDRICCGEKKQCARNCAYHRHFPAIPGPQALQPADLSARPLPFVASSRRGVNLILPFSLVLEKQTKLTVASLGLLANNTFTVGMSTTAG